MCSVLCLERGCAPLYIVERRPNLGTLAGEKRRQTNFAPSFPALVFRHGEVSEGAAGSGPGLRRPPQGAGRPRFGPVRAGLSCVTSWPILAHFPVGASAHFARFRPVGPPLDKAQSWFCAFIVYLANLHLFPQHSCTTTRNTKTRGTRQINIVWL